MSLTFTSQQTAHRSNGRAERARQALHFSSKVISRQLLQEITNALNNVDEYGSVEIFIQDSTVTQITTRSIKKTGRS